MFKTKIIIYPLILALLLPLTAFATEAVGQEEVPQEQGEEKEPEKQEENLDPEISQESEVIVPEITPEEPEVIIPEITPEEPEVTIPEISPEDSQTEVETITESETESETETETEEPETLLDEDTKGLLKQYLSEAVSGNSMEEVPEEPVNTEYQDYVKQALQVLQDNSTSQINVSLAILMAVSIIAGFAVAYMFSRRFL